MLAQFRCGKPIVVDHTPSADVATGDILVVGDLPLIAHTPIPADQPGSLAAGHGVYKVPKATGASSAIAGCKRVYWDSTNKIVTTTAGSLKGLGYTTPAGAGDNDATVEVLHAPW